MEPRRARGGAGRDGPAGQGDRGGTLWDLGGREAIADHLRDVADEHLAAREAEVGEEDWGQVERVVLLRTIDSLWVEHLTEVDDMRRGIGLRGYAQQDPLNEFRREAYRMYEELRGLIRHGVASSIFRVTVQRQPPDGGELAALSSRQGAAALAGARRAADGVATATARRLQPAPRRGRRRRPCRRLGDPARRAAGRPAARNVPSRSATSR